MRPRNIINVCAGFIFIAAAATAISVAPAVAQTVSHPSSSALSPKLSDLPTAHWAQGQNLKMVPRPKPLLPPGTGPGGPSHPDGALQHEEGPHLPVNSKTKFGGVGANGFIPPDPNIAVGKTVGGVGYIVQMVNSQIAVFNKSGTLLSGPTSLSSLWTPLGGACAGSNAGDPVVQYDVAADRWLVTQLGSTSGPTYSECIAVSQTGDPRGSYNLYSYDFSTSLNDYPKFGVWPTATNSAYLATYNMFTNNATSFAGAQLCAYDRNAMLNHATSPASVCVTVPDGNFLPSDLDGATPPPDGTPGLFLNFETTSSLRLYQLSLDFGTPANSTLSAPTDIAVAPFAAACNGGVCIVQPNSQKLDSLGDRLMYRLAYRIFSDHASMVVNHSVTAGSSVGVRWYELQAPIATPAQFSLYQQGTFAPDSVYRWMGSAAMDGAGNIAIGYSKSSSSIYPAIAIASRTPAMPLGTMGTETILQAGAGAQTTYDRWGDYLAAHRSDGRHDVLVHKRVLLEEQPVFQFQLEHGDRVLHGRRLQQPAGFRARGVAQRADRQSRLKRVDNCDRVSDQRFEFGQSERQRSAQGRQRQFQHQSGDRYYRRRDLHAEDHRQPQRGYRQLHRHDHRKQWFDEPRHTAVADDPLARGASGARPQRRPGAARFELRPGAGKVRNLPH